MNMNEQAIDRAINDHAQGRLAAPGRLLLREHFGHDPDDKDCPVAREHGLGLVRGKPEDEAATPPLSEFLAATGIAAATVLPTAAVLPAPLPPTFNQGTTPQCVAFGMGWLQVFHDLRDTGKFAPDFARYFREIGGGSAGAVLNPNALEHSRLTGYPVLGASSETGHKIASWYKLDLAYGAIKSAHVTFHEPLPVIGLWGHSWFHPYASGQLPAWDYSVGGHCWLVIGYDDNRSASGSVRGINQWGSWGLNGTGHFFLSASSLTHLWGVYKTADAKLAVKRTTAYSAKVRATQGSGSTFGTALGSVIAGTVITTTGSIAGASWTSPSGATGTKWYRVTAIGGHSTIALYGRAAVYIYAGAVKGG